MSDPATPKPPRNVSRSLARHLKLGATQLTASVRPNPAPTMLPTLKWKALLAVSSEKYGVIRPKHCADAISAAQTKVRVITVLFIMNYFINA